MKSTRPSSISKSTAAATALVLPYIVVLLHLMTTATVAVEQSAAGAFQVKTTLPILSETLHHSCELTAGYNLTMITCSGQFEVYDT